MLPMAFISGQKIAKRDAIFHFEPFTLILFVYKRKKKILAGPSVESEELPVEECFFFVELAIPVRVGKAPFQPPLQRDSRQAKKAAEERDLTKEVTVL